MRKEALRLLLDRLPAARVAVLGDFCLDVYWDLDQGPRGTSVETGRSTWTVVGQRTSPGGAGNTAANLAALGLKRVEAIGIRGRDPFGEELARLLDRLGVGTAGLLLQEADWLTPAYVKPFLGEIEQDRFDHGPANRLSLEAAARLVDALERTAAEMDVLLLNQQLPPGLFAPEVARAVAELARRQPVVADCRDFSLDLGPVIYKANVRDLAPSAGAGTEPACLARRLQERTGRPVFLTLGAEGILVLAGKAPRRVPGIPIEGPIDPVGAGDTAAAALAAALAAGAEPEAAAELANLAAAVTVGKLRQTGMATPGEILALAASRAR